MKNMYLNSEYLKMNPTWHVEDSVWKAEQIIKMINRNNIQPLSICDVGCGAGETLNQLYVHMSDKVIFDGYDISPQAFSLCQDRRKERLQFHLKDIIQDENVFFDIVMAMDVCVNMLKIISVS